MNDTTLFAFEDDFVVALRCIPMAVRFKLDLAEVKLSLRQWSRLGRDERRNLLRLPCGDGDEVAAYRARLIELITQQGDGEAKPLPPGSVVAWNRSDRTPDAVIAFARSKSVPPPSDKDWQGLTPLQRFVLLKLSRDKHDNVNFVPALREFGVCHDAMAAQPSDP